MREAVRKTMEWVKDHSGDYIAYGEYQKELLDRIRGLEFDDANEQEAEDCYENWTKNFVNNPVYAVWGVHTCTEGIVGKRIDSYFVDYKREEDSSPLYFPLEEVIKKDRQSAKDYFEQCVKDFEKKVEVYCTRYSNNRLRENERAHRAKAIGWGGLEVIFVMIIAGLWRILPEWQKKCIPGVIILATAIVMIVAAALAIGKVKFLPAWRGCWEYYRIKKLLDQKNNTFWEFEEIKKEALNDKMKKVAKSRLFPFADVLCEREREVVGGTGTVHSGRLPGCLKTGAIVVADVAAIAFICFMYGVFEPINKPTNEQESLLSESNDVVTIPDKPENKEEIPEFHKFMEITATPGLRPAAIAYKTAVGDINVRPAPTLSSPEGDAVDWLPAGIDISFTGWIGNPKESIWGKFDSEKLNKEVWINRKTVRKIYEDEIPILSCTVGREGKENLGALYDGYLQSAALFPIHSAVTMESLQFKLQERVLVTRLLIYSGNYDRANYRSSGMVTRMRVQIDGTDLYGIPVRRTEEIEIERDYDLGGFWVVLDQGVLTDRISIQILDTEPGSGTASYMRGYAYISEITVFGDKLMTEKDKI